MAHQDVESSWASLEPGLNTIMGCDKAGIANAEFLRLYGEVFQYCTQSRSTAAQDTTQFKGTEIYKKLETYLQTHLTGLKETFTSEKKPNIDLLKEYARLWDQYTTASKVVDHLFRYLNRFWVKKQLVHGNKSVFFIYTLTIVSWRNYFLHQTHNQVIGAILELVAGHRDGVQDTDLDLIKHVLESLVDLGVDDGDNQKSQLGIYREFFETPFLKATEKYYKIESERFMSQNPVTEYMKQAEKRLEEEKVRAEKVFHTSSRQKVLDTCQKVLIEDHHATMCEEIQELLNEDRAEDLARMYRLFVRIPRLLVPLRELFERHVKTTGLAAVSRLFEDGVDKPPTAMEVEGNAAPTKTSAPGQVDPKVYVDTMLSVYRHYSSFTTDSFSAEAGFVAALDKACREFVNCKLPGPPGKGLVTSKCPELLARYCDSLLKKSSKSYEDAELEQLLTDVMQVFKYIEDKDVFQKFYSKMLAKRLVQQLSASDDAEGTMIGKLREACGYEYTSKLSRMFTDMGLSKEMSDGFAAYRQENDKASAAGGDSSSFSINVLSTAAWPLSAPTTLFNIPEELAQTLNRFSTFYDSKHTGRKLTWLYQHSRGELKATYLKNQANKPQPYTFQVSLYQMAILLHFNNETSYSPAALGEATGLSKEILDGQMNMMLKSKLILKKDDRVGLNKNFKSKKVRINLNIGTRGESKVEVEETHKNVEEDRKLLIQAAIVRIMKTRKRMKHVTLVQEVIQQLTPRFKPRVPDIKRCIDVLLEKEYIARDEGQKDMLSYVA